MGVYYEFNMNEDSQCETMGINAISLPLQTPPGSFERIMQCKRKYESFPDSSSVISPAVAAVKKIRLLTNGISSFHDGFATDSLSVPISNDDLDTHCTMPLSYDILPPYNHRSSVVLENGRQVDNKENFKCHIVNELDNLIPKSSNVLDKMNSNLVDSSNSAILHEVSGDLESGQTYLSKDILGKTSDHKITSLDCSNPKVIVQHQPLPSIYELHQITSSDMLSICSIDDSNGDNEENEDDDDALDEYTSDDESADESEISLSNSNIDISKLVIKGVAEINPQMSKLSSFQDNQFWSQGNNYLNNTSCLESSRNLSISDSNTLTNAASLLPSRSDEFQGSQFQFLDQSSNQRIECAENGKSYLQLGTMNHHHIPVVPVIQPRNSSMSCRRSVVSNVISPVDPPFFKASGTLQFQGQHQHQSSSALQSHRQLLSGSSCSHTNCMQRSSVINDVVGYRTQCHRIMNLSLHKLHLARQNHESCLRRSVLICNLLRHVEDETEKDGDLATNCTPQFFNQMQQNLPMESPGQTNSPFWSAHSLATCNNLEPPLHSASIPAVSINSRSLSCVTSSYSNHTASTSDVVDMYESTLKDFNNSFRMTPFSSPSHYGFNDSIMNDDERIVTTTGVAAYGGINWSSVLSLSNQAEELESMNNNHSHQNVSNTSNIVPTTFNHCSSPTTSSSLTSSNTCERSVVMTSSMLEHTKPLASSSTITISAQHDKGLFSNCISSVKSSSMSNIVLANEHSNDGTFNLCNASVSMGCSYDDIGWKLSADDVLKAFPYDENIFVGR